MSPVSFTVCNFLWVRPVPLADGAAMLSELSSGCSGPCPSSSSFPWDFWHQIPSFLTPTPNCCVLPAVQINNALVDKVKINLFILDWRGKILLQQPTDEDGSCWKGRGYPEQCWDAQELPFPCLTQWRNTQNCNWMIFRVPFNPNHCDSIIQVPIWPPLVKRQEYLGAVSTPEAC